MKVSIIVPAYNAEKTIARAISSIQAQTHTDWELLVIDDGSTDRTAAIAEDIAVSDPRICVLRNEVNRGVSASRNRGLDKARGRCIAFLDSDDEYDARFLEEDLVIMQREKVDWVKHFHLVHTPEGKSKLWGFTPKQRRISGHAFQEAFSDYAHDIGAVNGSLFSRKAIDGIRFSTHLSLAEDALATMELLCRNTMLYVSEQRVYHYHRRWEKDSLSFTGLPRPDDAVRLLSEVKDMLDRYPGIPEDMYKRLLSFCDRIIDRHYQKAIHPGLCPAYQKTERIDIVICYVDGRDPQWQHAYDQTIARYKIPSGSDGDFSVRFVTQTSDVGNEDLLRYVFRSIEKYMPFVREEGGLVHLVVASESQVPAWINREKVDIVRHRDIIPECFLPTFNSGVIEMFLHKIPGLAERFIYFNDDMFAASPLNANDFFHGWKIRTRFFSHRIGKGNRDAAWRHGFTNSVRLGAKPRKIKGDGKFYFSPPHVALPLTRSLCAEVWRTLEKEIVASLTPLRDRRNVNQYLFPAWALAHGKSGGCFNCTWRYHNTAETDLQNKLHCLDADSIQLVCINDVPHTPEANINAIYQYLKRKYPDYCRFEKEKNDETL